MTNHRVAVHRVILGYKWVPNLSLHQIVPVPSTSNIMTSKRPYDADCPRAKRLPSLGPWLRHPNRPSVPPTPVSSLTPLPTPYELLETDFPLTRDGAKRITIDIECTSFSPSVYLNSLSVGKSYRARLPMTRQILHQVLSDDIYIPSLRHSQTKLF